LKTNDSVADTMRLERGLEISKKPENTILAITGDGTTEFNILNEFARKYNGHSKLIYFPKTPMKNPRKRVQERIAGLAILNVIKTTVSKYGIENYIFLVDREYIQNDDDIVRYLSRNKIITNILRDDIIISGRYGSHNIKIFCVVSGRETKIEENIADLIRIRFNQNINPTKSSIKQFCRENYTDVKNLISEATRDQLEQAFPELSRAMRYIERV